MNIFEVMFSSKNKMNKWRFYNVPGSVFKNFHTLAIFLFRPKINLITSF